VLAPAAALAAALALTAAPHRPAKPAAATPDAPVREGYRLEAAVLGATLGERQRLRLPTDPPHRGQLFSRGLAALLERDARYSELTGQVGNLDYDPFLGGQDAQPNALAELAVEAGEAAARRAEVRARFTNLEPRVVRFLVVLEDGRWVIDDVRDGKTSLRAELSRPYFCADGWTEACVPEPVEEELRDSLDPAAAPSR
jgi:hypothetical protein